jgi:hypothetical protein
MLEAGGKGLTKCCRNRAGDTRRSVTVYRSDSTTRIYRRDGLRESYTDDQVAALVRSARDLNATLHEPDIEKAPLGPPVAGGDAVEDAFVIQLPADDTSGVVATFDAEIGADLATFIDDCQRAVLGE